MKKRKFKQSLAITMALFMAINSVSGTGSWTTFPSYAETTAKVNATTLNVRSGPGTSNSIVGKLTNGTLVSVIGTVTGSDGKKWNQIRFTGTGGNQVTGYVLASYLKAPTAYTSDMNFESYLTAQGFPESYKEGLRQLHAEYPNWVFTAQHTNLDWETVISNESVVGRNLVYSSSLSSWKSTADGAYNWDTSTWPGFDSSSYVAASEDIIRYYMDPRNFLDDKYVFQFLLHSYDPSAQTAGGLESMVKNTFLSGSTTTSGTVGGSSGNSGGPGVVGPGVSGSSGSTSGSGSSSGGASLTGPGSTSGSAGSSGSANSSGTASLTGPGNASGSGSTPNSGSTSGAVSFTAPGSGTGSGNNTSGKAPSGNGSSSGGVSLTAPGSLSSNGDLGGASSLMPGASISKKETTRVTTAIGPGMTSGPGGSSSSDGSGSSTSSNGPGGASSSGGTSAPMASYVDIIMNTGAQTGVNPYVLAAMILQEQGNNGTGRSISGTVAGYTGYYNFFNIEAYQSGSMDAVSRGLWYASQSGSYERPWNSVDKSILGGASYYATNYVKVGQDTFYLKKFNVQGSNLYKHQYMTNIQGAASEGAKLAEAYGSELKKSALEFKIPVYQNMPEAACAKPTTDGSPNNKLSGLGVDGFALTPTFNRDITSYDLIVNPSVSEITINAVPLSSTASISGTGNIQLQSGNNEIKVSVTAQNGNVREYLIHVVRQDNGPTHNSALGSGINGSSSGNNGYGPGYSSVEAGPGVSSGSSGSSSQSSSDGTTGTGPSGSSQNQVMSGTGPGQSGGGSSSENTGGPGGSNVTIVR